MLICGYSQVRVGDIVRLQEDQYIPADLILLSSSLPHGTAYIQTANLDGFVRRPPTPALTHRYHHHQRQDRSGMSSFIFPFMCMRACVTVKPISRSDRRCRRPPT
jgi:hypothetical protein